ncbi:methyltransferase domain-containing protein [Minwuia thermotolerans]|uniref:methyltransferase domain-containing protein n=1 Tax=Minwuia thermotolerans TaxID=2056226 RepID=UPI0019CF5977|nr:methyltransferase domain-containing protein [Minwuia thermotolerans]
MSSSPTRRGVTAKSPSQPQGRGARARTFLGPIADLESHLPAEWWRDLFDDIYLKTDGDVVENAAATTAEIDLLLSATGVGVSDRVLDLCCGQGRHAIELARRGFRHITGVDRSHYLIRLARQRAEAATLPIQFREGDARQLRVAEMSQDLVMLMGNSFGYFASEDDDLKVLKRALRALAPGGRVYLDLTDGDWIREHFEKRSWEWIDQNHFVCRERGLSADGSRLISREVVVHDERGVLADQFYAERLYNRAGIAALLERAGFGDVRFHGRLSGSSERNQDLGMMAHREIVTAIAPRRQPTRRKRDRALEVAVLLGDPALPDPVKLNGRFNTEDFATVDRLKNALAELEGYRFSYLDNHAAFDTALEAAQCDLVLNLCDEGWNNDAFQELHVPARLDLLKLPYTGAGPACLAACYDKALVRAVAASLDIPVPAETYLRPGDQAANLPGIFPAILKPNFGDSSIGITKDAIVHDTTGLIQRLDTLKREFGERPILIQEFLTGTEYTVGLIGNPGGEFHVLPVLEVDYGRLDQGLPRILGYESKYEPDSPYWNDIRYVGARLSADDQRALVSHASRLFDRLGCRDYARFDFRADAAGQIRLLEVNPNPGWCWDGKMNLAAGLEGLRYSEFLARILEAACQRLGIEAVEPRQTRARRA